MQPIMLQICEFIDRRNPANIRETIIEYMNSIRGLPYPYRPALHDTSKFTMLNDGMRDAWLQYLINKILLGENEQTIFDNMKLFVLLYNYIGPVNGQIIFPNPYNVNYRTVIGALIYEHFKVCEPAIGVTEKKRQEELSAKLEANAKANAEVEANAKSKSYVKTIGRIPSPAARGAEFAAQARVLKNEELARRRQGGGNRNNHTRRNKNKRKKNSKSKTKTKTKTKAKSSPKHRKAIPSSRSGSQSNRKKSKPKKSQKNVTFKRRRARK